MAHRLSDAFMQDQFDYREEACGMSQDDKDMHVSLILTHASYYVVHDVQILQAKIAAMGVSLQKSARVFGRTFLPDQLKGCNAHFNDAVQY